MHHSSSYLMSIEPARRNPSLLSLWAMFIAIQELYITLLTVVMQHLKNARNMATVNIVQKR